MTYRPLIVLSFEGLATAGIGCYGSSWNQTPALDAIAGGGCVWDRWILQSDDSLEVIKRWFSPPSNDWVQRLRAFGAVDLITDDHRLARHADRFDEVITLPDSKAAHGETAADDIESTQLAGLIAAAVERDSHANDPWSVLWLHSRFLTTRWDSPRDLFAVDDVEVPSRDEFQDTEPVDGDRRHGDFGQSTPLMFDSAVVPQLQLEPDSDPDLITSWMRTYGCQVRLIDLLVEILLQSIGVDDPQIVLVGTSGFSLGQNGWIGSGCGTLRSPEIRVPMILSDVGPLRMPHATSADSLCGLLGGLADEACPMLSPASWSSRNQDQAIETRSSRVRSAATAGGWFFVRDADASEHLFLKPDDVEDFNDVGRLRPDVIDRFDDQLTRTQQETPPID